MSFEDRARDLMVRIAGREMPDVQMAARMAEEEGCGVMVVSGREVDAFATSFVPYGEVMIVDDPLDRLEDPHTG